VCESEDVEVATEVTADNLAEPLPKTPEEFSWTGFREKRLGRLVAECRYDFQKVASRLSQEFSCTVDVDSCRQQYRKLVKPRDADAARADLKADAGRARDAPEMNPDELEEVKKWWIHKISTGASRSEGRPTAKPSKQPPPTQSIVESNAIAESAVESSNTSAYDFSSEWAAAFETSGDGARQFNHPDHMPSSTLSAAGNLLGSGSMDRYEQFAPPPRAPAAEMVGFGTGAHRECASSGANTSVQGELFELD